VETYKNILAARLFFDVDIKQSLCEDGKYCPPMLASKECCEFCFINDFISDFEEGLYEEESDD
jgi:hypothetical protein